ncbi:MAG: toast rack family protein [Candidatus Zixiibacteriota bacterium]
MIVLFIFTVSVTAADRLEEVTEKIDAEGAENISVNLDFGAGTMTLEPDDIAEAAVVNIFYDTRRADYRVEYEKRGSTGYLDMESVLRKHRNVDDLDNDWDIKLSSRYPTEINFDLGACEADIDLGGIPLTMMDLEIGAASGTIMFSKPNPVRLKELVIDVGASSLELEDFGNANFEYLEISSGAASVELDLRGNYSGESKINIDVGVGSLDVTVPKGVAVRIEGDDGLFSSLDFHGGDVEEIEDDLYESGDFDSAEDRITFNVDVGMGSVDFYFK